MTTRNFNAEATERDVNDFMSNLVPFGYLDITTAIRHAINAGNDADWAAEQVENFIDGTGVELKDIDPVYVVMDAILQEARGEIEQATGFDLCNDATQGEIYCYGNYMCSSYDYTEEAKQELVGKLAEGNVDIEDLSTTTQYFLDQLEISQEDINNAKSEETAND